MPTMLSTLVVSSNASPLDDLRLVERAACLGRFAVVTLRLTDSHATRRVQGTVIGMVSYFERLGLPTDAVRADLLQGGPMADPQHLHLGDVTEFELGGTPHLTRQVLRVPIAAVTDLDIGLRVAC